LKTATKRFCYIESGSRTPKSPATRDIPVLVASTVDDARGAYHLAAGYLRKPLDPIAVIIGTSMRLDQADRDRLGRAAAIPSKEHLGREEALITVKLAIDNTLTAR
jgi:hypothetical protein